jgi:hypothetical protein
MEPITATIVAALAAGAAAGAKSFATSAITDGYSWLKRLIAKKDKSSATALAALEARPASGPELTTLANQLEKAGVASDGEIAKAAQALLDAIDELRDVPEAAPLFDFERLRVYRDVEATDIDTLGTVIRAHDVEIRGGIKVSGIRQHAPGGNPRKN